MRNDSRLILLTGGPAMSAGDYFTRSKLLAICQTAIFDPAGVLGQLYWYLLYPKHQFAFAGMLRGIVGAMGESR